MDAINEDNHRVKYWTKRMIDQCTNVRFRNNDILFARITPCAENGKTAFIEELDGDEIAFGSTELIVISPKVKLSNPKYLYYLMKWEKVRNKAISMMEGSTARQRIPSKVFFTCNTSSPTPPSRAEEDSHHPIHRR